MARNQDTFSELYLKHTPRMYAVAVSIVLSKDLAEEVVQNVMIRFWHSRESTKIDTDIAGYLYRATCNEAYNLLRSEKRMRERELAAEPNYPDPDSASNDLKLYSAIRALPGRTGEVFRLLWTGEFSQAQ